MNFFHSYLSIGQSNQRWWWCHSRNKSWSHKKLEKSCRGISRIGLLNGPYFMAHVIMMNVCNTVFVKCAMSYCKPYIVLLNVLSWCYILSIRFSWNLLPWCSKFLFYWNFVFNFLKVVSQEIFHFFTWFVFSVATLESLWYQFDVSEIFWLILAAVKVPWREFNSKPSSYTSLSTDSARSSSSCCSVFSQVLLLSKPNSMNSIAGESLSISLKISGKTAAILPLPLCPLFQEPSYI